MDIVEYAKGLGVDLSQRVKSEKRYLVIVEVVHNDKKYVGANQLPHIDIQLAKRQALECIKVKVKQTDLITFRCLEIIYADVPVEDKWEMQPVFSRWIKPEELKSLLTN